MIRTVGIFFLMGFLHCNKWPKHPIQQLYQLNYTNSFDFIDKFLKIKPHKFDIYVANPKPKPTTKTKPNQTQNLNQNQQEILSFLNPMCGGMTLCGSGNKFSTTMYRTKNF